MSEQSSDRVDAAMCRCLGTALGLTNAGRPDVAELIRAKHNAGVEHLAVMPPVVVPTSERYGNDPELSAVAEQARAERAQAENTARLADFPGYDPTGVADQASTLALAQAENASKED